MDQSGPDAEVEGAGTRDVLGQSKDERNKQQHVPYGRIEAARVTLYGSRRAAA